jgi:hypothetical protein
MLECTCLRTTDQDHQTSGRVPIFDRALWLTLMHDTAHGITWQLSINSRKRVAQYDLPASRLVFSSVTTSELSPESITAGVSLALLQTWRLLSGSIEINDLVS